MPRVLSEQDASAMICPFISTGGPEPRAGTGRPAIVFCQASRCMMWSWSGGHTEIEGKRVGTGYCCLAGRPEPY